LLAIDKICSKMLLPRSLSETAAKIYRSYSVQKRHKGAISHWKRCSSGVSCVQAILHRAWAERDRQLRRLLRRQQKVIF
jgi:hypothetical protein